VITNRKLTKENSIFKQLEVEPPKEGDPTVRDFLCVFFFSFAVFARNETYGVKSALKQSQNLLIPQS